MHGRAPEPAGMREDLLPLHGIDYVEFYVGNAKHAARHYRAAVGMKLAAGCGARESLF